MKVCDIKDCGKPNHGGGLCKTHYNAKWWASTNPRKTNPWTEEVKALVAGMLLEKLSASQIAARLRPGIVVTRNAVIGVVSRDPELRKIGLQGGVGVVRKLKTRLPGVLSSKQRWQKVSSAKKLKEQREMSANKRAAGLTFNVSGASVERSARVLMAQIPDDTRDLTARMFGDPLPGRRAIDHFECRSVPMVKLKRGECRWPVNEAEPGEIHLFCGMPAEGSYCPGHAFLSVGRGTPSERRAHYGVGRAA